LPAATVAGAPTASPAGGGGAMVPFILASNIYVEKFNVVTTPLGTSSQPQTINIIPNGYMSGIRMELRSSGATAGSVTPDSPWNVYSNIELDNIDGANIIYPMGGYAHYAANWFFKPELGDGARRFDYAQSINPSCSIVVKPEIRSSTAGVLANTDARSQYKIAYTLNPVTSVVTGISGTLSTTTTLYLETWAQPDARDLHNNPQEAVPSGLNLQTLRRHQILTLNGAGSANTFQLSNTGNELRGLLLIIRDSSNVRQDWLTDPIRMRLDTRAMGTFSPQEVFNLMNDFYDQLANGTSQRPTGTYMFPRFRLPGDIQGQGWLTTTNATYLILESATSASGTIGTVEIITDEAIPVGPVPAELDSI
jgi:hypothetical protein